MPNETESGFPETKYNLVQHPEQMQPAENRNLDEHEDELAPPVSKFVMEAMYAVGQRLISLRK